MEVADSLSINYTCGRIYLCFYHPAAAPIYNAQVEEASQTRVDNILKRGAGCHGNHMMRQAGLFKGIQLLLEPVRGKDKEEEGKSFVEYCN